ncbi:MAG: hypothetical protein ACI8V2_004461 [Candidatus Latescibacterota bacterium]|jgi:hypothetical protein
MLWICLGAYAPIYKVGSVSGIRERKIADRVQEVKVFQIWEHVAINGMSLDILNGFKQIQRVCPFSNL